MFEIISCSYNRCQMMP
uniref:Uncharacterized protein n=1 Tax=Rhizophora mucronata TaxID=61149 RepID=A0A2P2PZ40_RHIMU